MTLDPRATAPRSACQANAAAAPPASISDRSAASAPNVARSRYSCLICSGPMFGVHCKLICRNCGYREDCSDLFRISEPGSA